MISDSAARQPGNESVTPSLPSGRLEPLDALRGIAAFAVSLGHLSGLLTGVAATTFAVASLTPLAAFWRGDHAVLFFFMLSGFVLAIPFFKGPVSPTSFLVKRVLRIYPVYWLACVFGVWVLLQGTLPVADRPVLDLHLGINYLFLFGAFNVNKIDPVIWSLVHEIRVSLFFPFLMPVVKRVPSKWLLIGAAPIAWMGLVALHPQGLTAISAGATVWYAYFFLLGACLARHRTMLANQVAGIPKVAVALGLVLCLAAYGMPVMSDALALWQTALNFGLIAAGASGIILVALCRPLAGDVLTVRPLLFMGRISYGYYLLHFPVFTLIFHFARGRASNYLILVAILTTSILLSWLFNVGVERPAIDLGRSIARRLDRRLLKRSAQPATAVGA